MNLRLNTHTMTTSTTLFNHAKITSYPNRKHQIRKQAVLTYAEADALLDYNPGTGVFTRKVRMGRMGRMAKGTRADVPARSGYRVLIHRERYQAQQVAWLLTHGEWPPIGVVVEHKDLDKANNADENPPRELQSEYGERPGSQTQCQRVQGRHQAPSVQAHR